MTTDRSSRIQELAWLRAAEDEAQTLAWQGQTTARLMKTLRNMSAPVRACHEAQIRAWLQAQGLWQAALCETERACALAVQMGAPPARTKGEKVNDPAPPMGMGVPAATARRERDRLRRRKLGMPVHE